VAQASANPLLNQCSFKFRHCTDDLKHQPSRGRAEIKIVMQADERYPECLHFCESIDQLLEAPGKPV
jgi:hypothetical protein